MAVLRRWANSGRHWLQEQAVPLAGTAREDARNLYLDIAWFGVYSGVATTFTGVLAIRLGASNTAVGLLTSMPALSAMLLSIPVARRMERLGSIRHILLLSGFLMRLPALLIALVPLLQRSDLGNAVVTVTALGSVAATVSTLSFSVMLADTVKPMDRPRVVSIRNLLLSAVTVVAVLVAGQALELVSFPLNYQLVFSTAFIASLVSLRYVARVAAPDRGAAPQPVAGERAPSLLKALRVAVGLRDYRRLALASFAFHWGMNLVLPLYSIYRVRVLQISDGWIGVLSMTESACSAIMYYVWGRVAQKRGTRTILLIGAATLWLYPLATAFSTKVWQLLVLAVFGGIVAPAYGLGLFACTLEVVPQKHVATYLAFFGTLMSLAVFLSPFIGTGLATTLGVRRALMVGAGVRLVGAVVYFVLPFGPGSSESSGTSRDTFDEEMPAAPMGKNQASGVECP